MMWIARRNGEAFMYGRVAMMRRFGNIESNTWQRALASALSHDMLSV
jgi:hypothetical protein